MDSDAELDDRGVGPSNVDSGSPKKRRQKVMKTPEQLEFLERAYAESRYPSQDTFEQLLAGTGLSDRQLQMWFSHRRRRDKRAEEEAARAKEEAARAEATALAEAEAYARAAEEAEKAARAEAARAAASEASKQTQKRIDRAIALMHASYRRDGPRMATEFDPLPMGAFPELRGVGQKRVAAHDEEALPSTRKKSKLEVRHLPSSPRAPRPPPKLDINLPPADMEGVSPKQQQSGMSSQERKAGLHDQHEDDSDHQQEPQGRRAFSKHKQACVDLDARSERKRKLGEQRLQKEAELQTKKVMKEMERQQIQLRKMEEAARKEAERIDKERRREEERLQRERQKEDERLERERRKEHERLEKERVREEQRLEKEKQREELKLAREAAKAEEARRKKEARKLEREAAEGADDERLELEQLGLDFLDRNAGRGTYALTFYYWLPTVLTGWCAAVPLPDFPPQTVAFTDLFDQSPWHDSPGAVGELLMVWSFIATFGSKLDIPLCTIAELARSLDEKESVLLGRIHITMLRTIAMDMEEAATASQVGSLGAGFQAVAGSLALSKEATAWLFDAGIWRKHTCAITWPEVLRQVALAAGYGPKRHSSQEREELLVGNAEVDATETVGLLRSGAAAAAAAAETLMMRRNRAPVTKHAPRSFAPGSLKHAAWTVLSQADAAGLTVAEIVERIQNAGLKDLRHNKAPEAALAGSLSREISFVRVGPARYALRSTFCSQFADAGKESAVKATPPRIATDAKPADVTPEETSMPTPRWQIDLNQNAEYDREHEELEGHLLAGSSAVAHRSTQHSGDIVAAVHQDGQAAVAHKDEAVEDEMGEDWVEALLKGEYSSLTAIERLHGLVALCHTTIEGCTLRRVLEERIETGMDIRRKLWQELQEQRRRQRAHALEIAIAKSPGTDDVQAPNSPTEADAPNAETDAQRRAQRAEALRQAEEEYAIRTEPLGVDRRYNRYFQFSEKSEDGISTCSYLYFESATGERWGWVKSEEAYSALCQALDPRGTKERALLEALNRHQAAFYQTMKLTAKEGTHLDVMTKRSSASWRDWVWSVQSCASKLVMETEDNEAVRCDICQEPIHDGQEYHCAYCHATFDNVFMNPPRFKAHQKQCSEQREQAGASLAAASPALKKLKAELMDMEAVILPEAVQQSWMGNQRDGWLSKVKNASDARSLLQALAQLEGAVKPEWIRPGYGFLTTQQPLHKEQEHGAEAMDVEVPPWMPATTAAVALRLLDFDSHFIYKREDLPAPKAPVRGRGRARARGSRSVAIAGKSSLWPDFPEAEFENDFELPKPMFRTAMRAGFVVGSRGRGRGRGGRGRSRGRGRGRGGLARKAPRTSRARGAQRCVTVHEDQLELLDVAPSAQDQTPGRAASESGSEEAWANGAEPTPEADEVEDEGSDGAEYEQEENAEEEEGDYVEDSEEEEDGDEDDNMVDAGDDVIPESEVSDDELAPPQRRWRSSDDSQHNTDSEGRDGESPEPARGNHGRQLASPSRSLSSSAEDSSDAD
eukprot:jgi/Chlat1/4347/Chrsp29S04494